LLKQLISIIQILKLKIKIGTFNTFSDFEYLRKIFSINMMMKKRLRL